MAKRTDSLIVDVTYDDDVTDIDSVVAAVDRLIETALSTPGILDDLGEVEIGETQIP